MRIVAMLIIVTHHYVVNSGLVECYDFADITPNMLFLQMAGFGGKMAINAFVLLSAYFMCEQRLTWRRVLRLLIMCMIYKYLIYIIFIITGYESFTAVSLFKATFSLIYGLEKGFTASFIAFYLLIPFLNLFVRTLSPKAHRNLILFLLFIYTAASNFFFNSMAWSYIGWYVTLYFIASYIRFYPSCFTESKRVAVTGFLLSALLIWGSILFFDFVTSKYGFTNYYFMCQDSQKLLALTSGMFLFLSFKNIHIKQSRLINTVAATTFGVLLIHANSDAMRTFLWKDLCQNVQWYDSPYLPFHLFFCVIAVYIICVCIDYLRIRIVEKPLFKRLDKISWMQKECFIE